MGRRWDLRRILRRFGPAVVAIGVAVFASPLADQWPSTHQVEIALDTPAEVRSVSLSIVPHGETDPIFATSWSFESGQAPPRLETRLSTPNGSYDASIVTLRGPADAREETKRIDLDGNRITLFAR